VTTGHLLARLVAALLVAGCHAGGAPTPRATVVVEARPFGTTGDGAAVRQFTLTNAHGMVARVTEYGATLTQLWVPDRDGRPGNVVLGFDRLGPYLETGFYLGATMGRVTNRIANARFTLDGREYVLTANRAPNHIHGGARGFDKRVWGSREVPGGVAFTYTSPDGEEGYPGTVNVTVTYALTDANELRIDYAATTDRPTPINLTNHSFFNLAGQGGGTVLDHVLTVNAGRYTAVDSTLIPTGALAPVAGTPLDFTRPHRIGERIAALAATGGYDHNYVLDGDPGALRLAARLEEPRSGRVMEVRTTEPGMQFFTGNRFDGTITGVGGLVFVRHAGLALETQHFPNSINQPAFPSVVLRPGTTFRSTTVYAFSTDTGRRR
jgi:aldose 1-epimerase